MGTVIGDTWTDHNQNGRVAGTLPDGGATRTLHVMPGNALEIRTLDGKVLHRDTSLAAYPGFVARSIDGGRGEDGSAVLVVGGLIVDSNTSRTLVVRTDYRLAAITPDVVVGGAPTLIGPEGKPGRDGRDGQDGRDGKMGPPGPDGEDAEVTQEIIDRIAEAVAERVFALPPAPDHFGLPAHMHMGTRFQETILIMLANQANWQGIIPAIDEGAENLIVEQRYQPRVTRPTE